MHRLLADVHEQAQRRLPAAAYDYVATGAGDEIAAGEAEPAWRAFRLRPRVLRDVSRIDLGVTLLGTRMPTPIGIAPTAFHRLAHPDGEVATRRGAADVGALTVVSTRASRTLEDIAAAADGPWWFQVYVMRDRELTAAVVRRAAAAGAQALVLTGDTPYVGIKPRVDGVRAGVPDEEYLVNLARHLPAGVDPALASSQDPAVTLEAVAWLHTLSGLPVLVKGVLRGDDALRCVEAGAAGLIVSNHGGRQLSRAVPTAWALPDVAAALAGTGVPVLVDGGLRSGADILVALALGADAVLLGRPVLWGLAADGATGVGAVLRALGDDLAHNLAMLGAAGLDELAREDVVGPVGA